MVVKKKEKKENRCCSKVIMSGVNGNVIMSGCGDDHSDDERRESELIHREDTERVLSDFTAESWRTQCGKAATKTECLTQRRKGRQEKPIPNFAFLASLRLCSGHAWRDKNRSKSLLVSSHRFRDRLEPIPLHEPN